LTFTQIAIPKIGIKIPNHYNPLPRATLPTPDESKLTSLPFPLIHGHGGASIWWWSSSLRRGGRSSFAAKW